MTFRALFVASSLLISSQAYADISSITSGVWARGDGNARVRVSMCGGSLCAVNVWVKDETSEKVGDQLIMTVKPETETTFVGSAFDPQRNLRLSARIVLNGNSMTTTGCVLGGIICKSSNWTRR